jgi:hypothetical protein
MGVKSFVTFGNRLLSDTVERKACIDDLLHFVNEISLAEQVSML